MKTSIKTKRNAEAILKQAESKEINGFPMDCVKAYVSIAKELGLDEFEAHDAVDYIFYEIRGIFNVRLSRAITNEVDEAYDVYKNCQYAVGYLCYDGSYSMLRGIYDTEEEAEARREELQPNYKHRLEVKRL